jgi:hypothetical protein
MAHLHFNANGEIEARNLGHEDDARNAVYWGDEAQVTASVKRVSDGQVILAAQPLTYREERRWSLSPNPSLFEENVEYVAEVTAVNPTYNSRQWFGRIKFPVLTDG